MTQENTQERKQATVVIIGSGPAGYTAAIYCARANMSPVMYEGYLSGPAGGQLTTTTDVENYPGFPEGVMGPELVDSMRQQALRFGTIMLAEDVESVDLKGPLKIVKGPTTSYEAKSVIIATGATAKRLDIPGTREGEFWQKGVTACAVCDGAMPIFRNKDLYVIGGGDSAMEESLFLTKYASKVYVVHRRNQLRASKIMQERVLNHPKISVLWNSEVVLVEGTDSVKSVNILNHETKATTKYEAGGVFFAVGHQPNTGFLGGQITLHDTGYIHVQPGSCRTNIEFVYAAGDVQDHYYRQAITAAGMGCMAAIESERDLSLKGLI